MNMRKAGDLNVLRYIDAFFVTRKVSERI